MSGATEDGLWSDRRADDPPDTELDARVDELFTTAIERQVAEQRNLNQLLNDLDRSLASVRARLDAIEVDEEAAAERITALASRIDAAVERLDGRQSEVEQALATVAGELRAAFDRHADEVDQRLGTVRTRLTQEFATTEEASKARSEEVAAQLEGIRETLERSAVAAGDSGRQLLARAVEQLREQAERDRELLANEVAGIRSQLSQQVADELEHLRAAFGAHGTEMATGLDEQRSALARLEGHVSSTNEDLAAELRRLRTDVTNELAEVEALAGALTRARALESESREELGRDVAGSVMAGLDELRVDTGEALERHSGILETGLAEVTAVLEETRSLGRRVADLERSLVAYVEAWGDRVTQERRELVQETIARFASGLPKRERRRLTTQMEAPTDPAPPRATRPAPAAVPVVPKRKLVRVPPKPTSATPEPEAVDPRKDPDELGVAGSSPARRIRDALAGVRGVGPAKQSALIDAFGDLDALLDATEDELADVPGIGPALAASIHRRLH